MAELEPHTIDRVYVNALDDDGIEDRVRAAYGPQKYERLVQIKRKYDPANVFHRNANINPGASVPAQRGSFLALWCAKEAYLKAIGLGLRREPAEIAVSLADRSNVTLEDTGRPARLDEAFVTRAEAHGTPAILACVVLAR